MARDSLSKGENWEETAVRFERYVSWIEKVSTILLTLIWVSCWKSYIRRDLSVNQLLLFNLLANIFWCPLFITTNTLRLFYSIIISFLSQRRTDHSHLTYKRRRLEHFGFFIERIGMLLLRAPYSMGVRGKVFQFGLCAIPCLVLFPLANLYELGLWLSDFNQQLSSLTSSSRAIFSDNRFTAEQLRDFFSMLFHRIIICGLHVDDNSGELRKTNASTDPPAHLLDISDEDDDHHHSSIPDLGDSGDSGELKINATTDPPPTHPLDLIDDRNNKIPAPVESEDEGETVESVDGGETVESEDGGETVESVDGGETVESEYDKAVLSGSEEGSFVMLEFNKDDEEVQDSCTVEPREEQTETILEGKLVNNEEEENFGSEMNDTSVDAEQRGMKMEKLETEMCDLKKEIQKMVKSVENSDRSFGELIVKLSAATSQAEFYRLQAQESKENFRNLEEDRIGLIVKLAAANASAELYRSLLHDLEY